ncbi:four helix bundle protein [Candidatus Peregrinibacteria bacterium]|nr:MAG: four helix bundle protein [Candidatus Peregrinibacteria bacterium]
MSTLFRNSLKQKMDQYIHFAYGISKQFPRDELYGVTSQFRRSSLSVILNYIEGYARRTLGSQLNFFRISYGSLKESEYLFDFCYKENYLSQDEFKEGSLLADEIGAMLWSEINALEAKQ